jgi:signal transduction histidine kinase
VANGALAPPDVGERLSKEIRDVIGQQRDVEMAGLARIKEQSDRDVLITRVVMIGATLLNVVLIVVAGLLFTREINRRLAEGSRLSAERDLLEKEVAARTAEIAALSTHIQDVAEREKAALARELHDELGGLLISVKMDVSALRRKLGTTDADATKRWDRVLAALDAGIDLKRRTVESLHPTLLDNMGLHAALHWQLQETCRQAGLGCTASLPDHELPISKEAGIAIFRIAQESMTNILKHARATAAHLDVRTVDHELIMIVRDNGVGFEPERRKEAVTSGWASMRQRAESLGGSWRVGPGPDGTGTEVELRLPLDRIQIAP